MKKINARKFTIIIATFMLLINPLYADAGLFKDIVNVFKSDPPPTPQREPEQHPKAPATLKQTHQKAQLKECKKDEVLKDGQCVKQ